MDYSSMFSTIRTPQTEPIPGTDQIANNAGGFGYQVDKWIQLNRFLILGAEGGTYYVQERKLTQDNAKSVVECIKEDGARVIREIVDIITNGRAPKPDSSIFTLALICTFGKPEDKKLVYSFISTLCRTSTQLFLFCQNIKNLRGWSGGLRRGVADFYLKRGSEEVRYQFIKYRKRNGWTHRDVLRLCHAKTNNPEIKSLFNWVCGKGDGQTHSEKNLFLEPLEMFNDQKPTKERTLELIDKYKLPWECLPTELLNDKDICNALLPHMGLTAIIRNLGRLTANGTLVSYFFPNVQEIISKLMDNEGIKKSKVHPINFLMALRTYSSGKGFRGSLEWQPIQHIVDALNQAFYLSFNNILLTHKKIIIGLDVSGSMDAPINNSSLTAREAATAIAMMLYKTEKMVGILGFCDKLIPLNFGAFSRLDDILREVQKLPFGRTDCSLPMIWAQNNNIPVDAFIILTDSETYCGGIHPSQGLKEYRKKFNPDTKLIVCATSANNISIADPNDKNMLDICGFDASIPTLISDFIRGSLDGKTNSN